MADKTAISDKKFTLVLSDGTKVPELRTRSTYELGSDGYVRDASVDLLKLITKTEYDALPDNVKTDRDVQINPTSGTITEYYAILASRPPGRGSNFTYNTNVLNAISIRDGTANRNPLVPVGPNDTFKKDVAEYNNSGGRNSPFKTVTANASKAILKKENIKAGSAKDQTGLGSNTPDGSDATEESESSVSLENIVGEIGNAANDFKNTFDGQILKYPLNITDEQDSISFTAMEYGGLNFNNTSTIGDLFKLSKDRKLKAVSSSVILPIQSKISDTNSVEWGANSINAGQAFLLGFLNNPGGTFETLKESIKKGKAGGFLDNVGTAGKTLLFQEALGVKGLLSRTEGAIFNPNTELLFRGPQLRPFAFSFFLAARGKKEGESIRRIIRYFKQYMAIRETKDNLFLKAPYVFKIKYIFGRNRGDHPGINRIKECALQSFNVDYNPDNAYMTFEDGTMTAYRITMRFQELVPVVDSDYAKLNTTDIGF